MNNGFGIESPSKHSAVPHRAPARYLIVIDAGGSAVARMFTDTRVAVAEFDASTEEVALMTQGLPPVRCAEGPEWDMALAGHSTAERAGAHIYTLDV